VFLVHNVYWKPVIPVYLSLYVVWGIDLKGSTLQLRKKIVHQFDFYIQPYETDDVRSVPLIYEDAKCLPGLLEK
jgi:hypothetical protein